MGKKIQPPPPKNPTATFEEQSKSRVLCMPSAHKATKGVGRLPKSPLWPKPWTLPSYKETACPPSKQARKGTCCLLSLPLAAARAPIKSCLSDLINFH